MKKWTINSYLLFSDDPELLSLIAPDDPNAPRYIDADLYEFTYLADFQHEWSVWARDSASIWEEHLGRHRSFLGNSHRRAARGARSIQDQNSARQHETDGRCWYSHGEALRVSSIFFSLLPTFEKIYFFPLLFLNLHNDKFFTLIEQTWILWIVWELKKPSVFIFEFWKSFVS